MPDLWRIQDDMPGEHTAREEAVGLPPDVADEMEAQREAYEAEFPPVRFDDVQPLDPWGMASEWVAADDAEVDA